jgi:hypothetical protein
MPPLPHTLIRFHPRSSSVSVKFTESMAPKAAPVRSLNSLPAASSASRQELFSRAAASAMPPAGIGKGREASRRQHTQ